MLKIIIAALTIGTFAISAEMKTAYSTLDKNSSFQSDLRTMPVDNHAMFKKEAPEIHPIYKGGESTNEGRARIEQVKSEGPVVKFDLLNDQAAPSTEVNRIVSIFSLFCYYYGLSSSLVCK